MISTEIQLVEAYLYGRLTGAALDLAELLILTDGDAAAMVERAMDARDRADAAISQGRPEDFEGDGVT